MAQMLVGDTHLDDYITQKALDGLFLKVAAEEKVIRTQPVARTTDLLKKVFAGLQQPSPSPAESRWSPAAIGNRLPCPVWP